MGSRDAHMIEFISMSKLQQHTSRGKGEPNSVVVLKLDWVPDPSRGLRGNQNLTHSSQRLSAYRKHCFNSITNPVRLVLYWNRLVHLQDHRLLVREFEESFLYKKFFKKPLLSSTERGELLLVMNKPAKEIMCHFPGNNNMNLFSKQPPSPKILKTDPRFTNPLFHNYTSPISP